MDNHSLMRDQGSYIPFDKPVPIPSPLPTDDPQVHLCFNEQWAPIIYGALKVLCRPETWQGTASEQIAASASCHELLSAIFPGCDILPPHLNWYLDVEVDYGDWESEVFYSPLVGIYGGDGPWAKYFLVLWGTGYGGNHVTVTGHDWDTGDPVGGHFDDITIINELDPAGQTYVLTTVDCLDNSVTNSDFTPRSYSGDFKSLEFTTGNVTMYILTFTISGDWLCAGA
jgi:hypothetical protein